MKYLLAVACALLIAAAPVAMAAPKKTAPAVTRTYPNPEAAIATTAVVPAGYKTIYVSGMLPDVAYPDKPQGSIAAYGNTEEQTVSVIKKLKAALEAQGASLSDVVSMHVYLTGDPTLNDKMDFAGMMKGYRQFFGTPDQPNRPTRATVQVAGLVAPGFMVEIEVIAAVPAGK